jgi:hypothetical protein
MQRTEALSRIETMRFAWGQTATNLRHSGIRMRSCPANHSRGVEAVQRPQLTPFLASVKDSARSASVQQKSLIVTRRLSARNSRGICIAIPPAQGARRIRSRGGVKMQSIAVQLEIESTPIKSSITGFTNRLGPVYHVGTIKRWVCISS